MTAPEAASPDAVTAPIFDLEDVCKRRSAGDATFELRVERLAVRPGDKIAVMGRSGSGKSTLLDMLALILRPDSCRHFGFRGVGGEALDVARHWRARDQAALSRTRRRHIGYVLQSGGLLPYLSVVDNIDLPRRLLGLPDDGTVGHLAEQLGLASHLRKRPGELSVGERQRVAVARAFAHDPCIILADEPTASLDPLTGDAVMALFMEQVERRGVAAVVASHEWQRVEAAGLLPLAQSISADTATKRVSVVFSR